MPVSEFAGYSGKSNTGYRQKKNEDYIAFYEMGSNALFAMVADGSGGKESMIQPAAIVVNKVGTIIKRIYEKKKELLFKYPKFFLEEAVLEANDALIAFKVGDEVNNFGFATTITCALLKEDGQLAFAHVGNTRLYVLREGKMLQLTKDHTLGQELVDRGSLSEENYYTSTERLTLYNGLGISADPFVQTGLVHIKNHDLIVMSSDGLHYSIKDFGIKDLIYGAKDLDEATDTLIKAAIELKNYSDNISVNLIHYFIENGKEVE